VSPAHFAVRITAKHSGNLYNSGRSLEDSYIGGCHSALRGLGYDNVIVRACSDLRQV